MTTQHYDVIIIGTGAGGGTLAHKLAPSGKRVLLLERGGYLPREPENWDSREVFINDRYLPDEFWYDKDGQAFKPHQQYFVGGNTKFYGAVLFRLRERDFGEVQHYGGLSPAWPISYQDLEPHYTEAEKLYLVHGQAGEDPTEPPRSGPFPYPAVSHEPRIQQLSDDFEKAGHRPFHLPVGVDMNESDPEAGRCVRCDRFDGFPCLADGKADAHVRCVRPALKHGNVTLLTNARVDRLVTDGSGHRVTEVVVDSRGVREVYSGDIVVVSCGAVNSAALLLKSASDQHPNGLANAKLKELMGRLGCHDAGIPAWSILDKRIPLAGVAHQSGTVRFGDDPQASVLDVNCRAHNVDNLYVVDTSFFPSSSAVNPALTAMANALRVGDHLLERLDAHVTAATKPASDGRPQEVAS